MRGILPVAILIILAVFYWNSNAAGALPNLVRKWDKRIINNAPTKEAMNNPPAQALSGNDKLLEKKGELILLQERHRMFLLLAIVVSTPIILALVLFFLKKAPNSSGDSLIHAIGLVLVIEGTMFIAVSAITTEQLTAPIGILGAIAGYLFGSAKRKATEKTKASSTA
ncbi:MAG TPA: hypothetical protein ENJ30_03245 [Desulfobulbaceae bacterium]|nr:hypothetical protein [Desulfobulbaceae bacterium]